MRVTLIQSPGLRRLEIYQSIGVRAPPLGLASIAAFIEREGHKPRIIDAATLEMTVEDTVREALSTSPDVVGISAVTPTVNAAYQIAGMIKEHDPDIPIVIGGPHASFMYREALSNSVDYVAIGEGEETFSELLVHLEKKHGEPSEVRGLAYRNSLGEVKLTPPRPLIANLDELPPPARHLLPMDRYTLFDKPIKIIHIMASRGCPYGCIYCTTSYFWGRRYRVRSVENVLNELEEATEKYGTRIVVFSDDELTLNKKWVKELAQGIIERGLDISFTCGSRVSSIDPNMLKLLAKAGCTTIYYGVESYKQEDIEKIGKKITIDQVFKAVRWTHEAGMEAAGSFILGFPWQTIDDMKLTIEFAKKLNVDYAQFTVATPYPGTPLYHQAVKDNLIEVWDWDYYTTIHPVMRGYHFTRSQLARIISQAYRSFYMRPRFLLKQIKRKRLKTILQITTRIIKRYLESRYEKEERYKPRKIEPSKKILKTKI